MIKDLFGRVSLRTTSRNKTEKPEKTSLAGLTLLLQNKLSHNYFICISRVLYIQKAREERAEAPQEVLPIYTCSRQEHS
jgi:hypothetical protein